MNLTPVAPKSGAAGGGFGIYDGTAFIFNQTATSSCGTAWQLLRSYGLAFVRMRHLSATTAAKFGDIYALQQQGKAFATPPELLAALGLDELTQEDAASYMKRMLSGIWKWGASRFIKEFAGAVNRVNYNQANSQMNAMAGLVSFVPVAVPGTFAIKEGNSQLPKRLLVASNAQLHTAAVRTIQLQPDGRYSLMMEGQAEGPGTACFVNSTCLTDLAGTGAADAPGPFDAVIIATPLEGSGIGLLGLQPLPLLPKRTYQTTVTSFVTGTLNPAWFGVERLPPGDILVTSDADTPFSVIADKGPCSDCTDGARLYKLFSRAPLTNELAQALFVNHTVVTSRIWGAYPRFSPPESFAPFVLAPGLFYNNALENAASAMEVSAVAAMNNALLVMQHLQQPCPTPQQEQHQDGTAQSEAGRRCTFNESISVQ